MKMWMNSAMKLVFTSNLKMQDLFHIAKKNSQFITMVAQRPSKEEWISSPLIEDLAM